VSSSSATSVACQRSTSQRISTARWRGGRCCNAATNARRIVSRSTAVSAGSGVGCTQVTSAGTFRFSKTGSREGPRSIGRTRRSLLPSMSRQTFVAIR
jgi:hypothetical protein